MSRRLWILTFLPLLFVSLSYYLATMVDVESPPSQEEMDDLNLFEDGIDIPVRKEITVKGHIRSPIRIVTKSREGGDLATGKINKPGEEVALKETEGVKRQMKGHDAKVSLIVMSNKERMAIVNGSVMREGDDVDGMVIAKIEEDRVLLKGRMSKWIYMER